MKTYNKKRNIRKIVDFRFNIVKVLTVLLFVTLMIRITFLIVMEKEVYANELERVSNIEVEGPSSPRGRIYDRNYNLLVDNKAIPIIYYKKNSDINTRKEVEMAYLLANKMGVNYDKLTTRNIKDFWIIVNYKESQKLITEEEWQKLENRVLNNTDIYNLKIDRITIEILNKYTELDKEAIYIYTLMNKGYSYEEKVIKSDDLSDKDIAYIAENLEVLSGFDIRYDWERVYLYGDTFKSILGNISNIPKEEKEYYLANGYALDDIVGVSYIEKQYEDILKGHKDVYTLVSKNEKVLSKPGRRGDDIVLTIDINLQKAIDTILEEEISKTRWEEATELFNHAYVVIQDPSSGEILAMTGRQIIIRNENVEVFDITPGVLTSPMTPGSVVKGASQLVGYNTGATTIGEYKKDECIKLYSKPQKCSWRTLGTVNDLTALAQSSNVYQFKTAMKVAGFNYSYGAKFNTDITKAFETYRKTFNEFGLGVKTEIDLPLESIGNVGSNISPDLLLNYAIGQYDTYTTMQLAQYVNTVATGGYRIKPHLLKEVYSSDTEEPLKHLILKVESVQLNKVATEEKYIKRVQEGFREVMTSGLGKNFMGNSPKPAGKTGTSESFMDTNDDGKIDTPTLSNAFVGYAPYDNPIMSIAITYPNIVNGKSKSNSRSYANIRMTRIISEKFFEIYKKK